MGNLSRRAALIALALGLCLAPPALAQTTTLTMSSWVSPQHHLTSVVLQGWATEVEKATNGRVKFTMLPKHPSAPPGTFDAVRDGLVDLSYVTASYTPARHIVTELGATMGLRAFDAGPLANAGPLEGITALLATINRRYKVKNAGIKITGL